MGVLFWTAFVVVMALLFFLNKDTISRVLDKTDAKGVFVKSKKSPVSAEKLAEIPVQNKDVAAVGDGSTELHGGQEGDAPQTSAAASVSMQADPKSEKAEPDKAGTEKAEPIKPIREAVIYWVLVDPEGRLVPMRATRALPASSSPMSDALRALFASPSIDERKQGIRTLIPPETKLRSAQVKDGIAFINVSEEFQFNQYGIDGSLAQLAQVVFTATEFSTVKSVQFLIEGQKKDYLGAEGIWIGSPLSRTSF